MSRNWPAVTSRRPCRICAATRRCATSADGHVAKCTNVFDGPGVAKRGDDEVGDYAIYFSDGVPGAIRRAYCPPSPPAAPLADLDTRHRVYSALLAALPLWPEHRDALLCRGLSDADIDAAGYGSLPSAHRERSAAVASVKEALGGEIPADVPGLHGGQLPPHVSGLLIPVRDEGGKITALKVRRDGKADPRYLWLSSKSAGGASSGSVAHAPVGAMDLLSEGARKVVRITEGPLKADVATALSGTVTLAVPGAMAARTALPLLRALAPAAVLLSWDSDARTNPHVAGGLEHAAHLLAAELPDAALELETWPVDEQHAPKGIDDALAVGAVLQVHTREGAWRELVSILRASGREPRPETYAKAGMEAEAEVDAPSQPSAPPPSAPAPAQPGGDDDWRANLLPTARGGARKCLPNTMLILRSAPEWRGRLAWDEMSLTATLDGNPVDDVHVTRIRDRMERDWGFDPGVGDAWSAVLAVAHERPFHPVREYLAGLRWDGVPRLHRVAAEILGATDALSGVMMKKTFIAAVERVRRPGCKVETCTVLVGPQGWRKSTLWRVLGGPWFSDTHIDISNKDAFLQLGDAWIIELGEVEKVTSRRGADEIKPFLSSVEDRYVPKYERAVKRRKRGCVFVGTTNEGQFLEDPTGSRRYWCITLGHAANIELLRARVDQLWAEAVAICDACAFSDPERGAALWCLTPEEEGTRARAAVAFEVEDTWRGMVERWTASQVRADFTVEEILTGAIDLPRKDQSLLFQRRVTKILRAMGCSREERRNPRTGQKANLWFLPSGTGTGTATATGRAPSRAREPGDEGPDDFDFDGNAQWAEGDAVGNA